MRIAIRELQITNNQRGEREDNDYCDVVPAWWNGLVAIGLWTGPDRQASHTHTHLICKTSQAKRVPSVVKFNYWPGQAVVVSAGKRGILWTCRLCSIGINPSHHNKVDLTLPDSSSTSLLPQCCCVSRKVPIFHMVPFVLPFTKCAHLFAVHFAFRVCIRVCIEHCKFGCQIEIAKRGLEKASALI